MADSTSGELERLTGGCRCGAVRYAGRTKGLRNVVCGCVDCQRSSGSFLSVAVGFKADLFEVLAGEESLRSYTDIGDSGQPVDRFFCGTCGSQLFGRPASVPHLVSVRAVSLDEPFTKAPAFSVYVDHIPDWIVLDGRSSADHDG